MTQLYGRQFLLDGSSPRNDDIQAGGSYLNRALLQTLPTVYELEYPELWSLQGNLAVHVVGNLAGYAEKVEELEFQANGEAKEYVDHTSDIPTLTSAYQSTSFNVHTFAIATEYSLQQLAAMEVQPQKMKRELAAVDYEIRKLNHLLLVYGNTKRGSEGLYNNSSVPTESGSYDPAGGSETWQSHIDFFSEKITQIESNNQLVGSNRVGSIHIPAKLYSQLVRTRQANDSAMSVMAALKMDYPEIEFVRTNETQAALLERFGAKTAGDDEDRIIFIPSDRLAVDRLADAPNRMPSQWKDMTYRTVFYLRSSQTIIHKPASMLYVDIPKF